jgi:hypothetical protein
LRTRILIVVLGLSLGLGARFGYDLYLRWQRPPDSPPATPGVESNATKDPSPPRSE